MGNILTKDWLLPSAPDTAAGCQKIHFPALLSDRERRIEEARGFTLMSDVFLSVALQDAPACQHVLRILTGIRSLQVLTVRTQYRISKREICQNEFTF